MLERRFGWFPVVLTFLAAGAAGSALASVLEVPPLLSDELTVFIAYDQRLTSAAQAAGLVVATPGAAPTP